MTNIHKKKKTIFSLLVLISIFMLNACTSNIKATSTDGDALTSGQGLLALSVSSTDYLTLNYVNRLSKPHFGLFNIADNFRISKGKTVWLIPMKAGDYHWAYFALSRYTSLSETGVLTNASGFSVEPNKINYIGHIHIDISGNSFQAFSVNDEADMSKYISQNYPAYAKSLPFKTSITTFDPQINKIKTDRK